MIFLLLGHPIADLALEPCVELVLRDGVQHRAVVVGAGRLGIPRKAVGLRRHGNLVDLLPGPLEVGAAGRDDLELRPGVALALVGVQVLAERRVRDGRVADPLGAAERGLDGPLGLLNREEAE